MAETSTAPSTPAAQAAASRLAGLRPPGAQAAPAVVAEPEPKGRKAKKAKAAAEGGKKKKKPVKPILIGLLLLVVAYEVKGKVMKPHYGPAHPAPPAAIFDMPTSVTTNLPDGHLAQIAMSLQLTSVGSVKTITKDASEIMGTAVQIIGSQSYPTLLSVRGRLAVKAEILQALQKELGTVDGGQQVSAIYFTSYIVQ
ncbi:MAG: flagellar basal body-associated FliL family protein [Actinomycetota bacterium]|nr:flagellar basal body-associated FliL family protein [Actinomycetota bacterium]